MRAKWTTGLALVAALAGAAVWAPPSISRADDDAVIVVFVRRNGSPASGRVTIRDDDGHEVSCEVSQGGSCQIEGVTPGRHLVEVTPNDGQPSTVRPVMIPEHGKVALIVPLS